MWLAPAVTVQRVWVLSRWWYLHRAWRLLGNGLDTPMFTWTGDRPTTPKADASRVRQLIREGIAPAATPGRPGKGSDTPVSGGHTRDNREIVARLKRDDPGLAQQVIDGAVSPNAAAIRAGIRKPYLRVRECVVGTQLRSSHLLLG